MAVYKTTVPRDHHTNSFGDIFCFYTLCQRQDRERTSVRVQSSAYVYKLSVFITLEQREAQSWTPFISLEYLSCTSEFSIALWLIPRAIKAWRNDVDFRNSPTRYRIMSPEVKVVWMISWWKCDKLIVDHWIKGRESPLETNSTLLHLFLRISKSPPLIATAPCAQFDASSTWNQNGWRETGNT